MKFKEKKILLKCQNILRLMRLQPKKI